MNSSNNSPSTYRRDSQRILMRRLREGRRTSVFEPTNLGLIRETEDLHKRITAFRNLFMSINIRTCPNCNEAFPTLKEIPCHCIKYPDKFSTGNNMNPGEVPPALFGLSMIEELLIARASPVMKVWRLPGGQLKYKGHVIAFPQNINHFCSILPRLPAEISVLTIRREYNDTHADFRVRRHHVNNALTWLQANNPFYNDIFIDNNRIGDLPLDSNIIDQLSVIDDLPQQSSSIIDNMVENMDAMDLNDNDDAFDIETGFVEGTTLDHEQVIRLTLDNFAKAKTIPWPTIVTEPLNEHNFVGLLSKCFPTLFPFGLCELQAQRRITVTDSEYFMHLMKYKDGRFANHGTFRFFALNYLIRQENLKKGNLFYVHNKDVLPPTSSQLRDCFVEDNYAILAKNIVYFGSKTHGSPGFWTEKRRELFAMCDQLKPVTYFFTMSAADLHWPELSRILPTDGVTRSGFNKVYKYPLVTSWLFQERVKQFFENVLPHILNLDDYWYRYEWQSRGTGHVHAMLWIEDAPYIENIENASTEVKKLVCDYFSQFVTSWVHGSSESTRLRIQENNPCARNPTLISDSWEDYKDLCLFVQPHLQCTPYCLRRQKRSGKMQCKFRFPMPHQAQASITQHDNQWSLRTERNDSYVNGHNIDILRVWRANIDLKPVINQNAVLEYILKYCTKSEKISRNASEVLATLLEELDDDHSTRSVIQRMLMKLMAQRDYSAQEVCHLLMKYPLTQCSRSFIHLKMSTWTVYSHLGRPSSSSMTQPFLLQYRSRDPNDATLVQMSFLNYVKTFSRNYKGKISRRRGKKPIVVVYPYLPSNPLTEIFCERYLILHKPHFSEQDCRGNAQNWMDAYSQFKGPTDHQQEECNAEFSSSEPDGDEDLGQCQWMAAQGTHPSASIVTFSSLGSRPFDLLHDWAAATETHYEILKLSNFIKDTQKESILQNEHVASLSCVLSEDQQQVYSHVQNHFYSDDPQPLRIIIQGPAGSGKSQLLRKICDMIYSRNHKQEVMVTATTGVAAAAIGGQTIHSAIIFKVKNGQLQDIQGLQEKRLQNNFRNIKYVIIDEFSMIGLQFLCMLDNRLRKAKPHFKDYPFGNMSMILVGDLGQLPVVKGTPVYVDKSRLDPSNYQGFALFQQFTHLFQLTTIHRQVGTSENDTRFKDALSRLRDGQSTIQDWEFFVSRHKQNLTESEYNLFNLAPRAFSLSDQVKLYNTQRLREHGQPVARIKSVDLGNTLSYSGRLEHILLLSKGTLVMLVQNYWVDAGLVNGSLGTVQDIVYKPDDTPPSQPLFVLVDFQDYRGPALAPGYTSIPVAPETHCFTDKNGKLASRTQLPLLVAYAVTIHKTQGLTLPKLVANFGETEFTPGITYVGMSRVRSINDIIIEGCFNYDRIQRLGQMSLIQQRIAYEKSFQSIKEN